MTGERTRAPLRGSSEQKTAGQESGVERASNKEQRTRHAAGRLANKGTANRTG